MVGMNLVADLFAVALRLAMKVLIAVVDGCRNPELSGADRIADGLLRLA
jgi:hypothetical protein